METSKKGLMALVVSEGIVPTAYWDNATPPVLTFGIGHTAAAGFPDPKDWIGKEAEMDFILELFKEDVKEYEEYVEKFVKVPLRQNQFDALVHFVYNIGPVNLKKSKLLKALNSGNYKWAGEHGFHGWLKPKSLRSRRDKESKIFLNSYYGSSIAPLYSVNKSLLPVRSGTIDVSPFFKDNLPSSTCSS